MDEKTIRKKELFDVTGTMLAGIGEILALKDFVRSPTQPVEDCAVVLGNLGDPEKAAMTLCDRIVERAQSECEALEERAATCDPVDIPALLEEAQKIHIRHAQERRRADGLVEFFWDMVKSRFGEEANAIRQGYQVVTRSECHEQEADHFPSAMASLLDGLRKRNDVCVIGFGRT